MMIEENNELISRDQPALTGAPETIKKPYVKPRLTLHGNVEQIIQGVDGGNQDSEGGGNSLGGEA